MIKWHILIVALAVFDILLTYALLGNPAFAAVEANPLARYIMSHGWAAVIVFKALCIGIYLSLVLYIQRKEPQIAYYTAITACTIQSLVVIWGASLLIWLTLLTR